jgi:hypothetical protein
LALEPQILLKTPECHPVGSEGRATTSIPPPAAWTGIAPIPLKMIDIKTKIIVNEFLTERFIDFLLSYCSDP